MSSLAVLVGLVVCWRGAGAWDMPLTSSGSLKGALVNTRYGQVLQYLGVRYADTPRRFDRPRAYRVLDTGVVVDALEFAPSCVQPKHLTDLMYPQLTKLEARRKVSEDCLFLNVFAPAAPADKGAKRPVMVWLPGEGFGFADASQFDATWLAIRGDVIVITVNYRLGVFGFLSTGNATAPGNQGLWDVLEALRWVRANSGAFGGDPARVTLFGRFSGAMVASLLLTSPELVERNDAGRPQLLVARMILQSGVASGNYVIDSNPGNRTSTLARLAGCSGSTQQIVACLREIPSAQLDTLSWSVPGLWRPVLDGTLVPTDPLRAVRRGTYNRNIDVIIGETEGEGSLCILHHYFLETIYATQILSNNVTKKEFVQLIKEHVIDYTKIQDPSILDASVHEYRLWPDIGRSYRNQFLDFCGLLYIRVKNEQFARALTKRGTNVWRYEFAHRPSISVHPDFLGVAHGDEVIFVFALLETDEGETPDPKEAELVQKVVTAWTNFAKTGDPNDGEGAADWPKFLDSSRLMHIFSTSSGKTKSSEFLSRAVDFWGTVVPSLARNSQRAVAQGRDKATCAAAKRIPEITTCPAVLGLVALSLILASALLLIAIYFCQLVWRSPKGLLSQEHISQ